MQKYLSLVKFSHTMFALPFALVGLFWGFQYLAKNDLALDKPWYISLLLVLGCMVTARNAAMAFNRYLDRDIDAKNERTASREIPAGIISARNARLFVIVNALAFVTITWFINLLCFFLSPIALLVILGYSYTKRFTPLCHLVLGLGLALAPVGAFLAVTGRFSIEPIILGLGVLTWVSGFDIIYSLQDAEFDKSQGLYSIPSWLGGNKALLLSIAFHIITAGCIILFGILIHADLWYIIGAGTFIILLAYQHLLVKADDLSKVNLAFFTTNGVASLLFGLFCIAGWLV
jgi:4-hydroxybenzoate polyprenyltransferase